VRLGAPGARHPGGAACLSPTALDDSRGTEPELTVLLLIADSPRRQHITELISRHAPASRIETVAGALDVMRRLARSAADLLVLEHASDGVAGPSLIRHLARAAPSLSVLAFDEQVASAVDPECDLWLWSEAEVALKQAIERWRRRGSAGA
jgi:DNA-binding NarL/FixJ family response regulator